jgi:hypothetical protein
LNISSTEFPRELQAPIPVIKTLIYRKALNSLSTGFIPTMCPDDLTALMAAPNSPGKRVFCPVRSKFAIWVLGPSALGPVFSIE